MNQTPIFRIFGATELLSAEGQPVDDILRRPKRLALLSYLVLASQGKYYRRDTILGLFWPELDQERARGALRQALYGINKALGEGVILKRGASELGVDASRLWCDAVEFEQRLKNGRVEEALSLYEGDALVGLFVPGAGQELEQWLADERERLRNLAVNAAVQLARSLIATDHAHAAHWAAWAAAHSRDDEKVVRESMSLLAMSGDRAGALRAYEQFASRLRSELESDPSRETIDLATAIRSGKVESVPVRETIDIEPAAPEPVAPEPVAPVPVTPMQPPLGPLEVTPPPTQTRRIGFAIAAVVAIAAITISVVSAQRSKFGTLRNHTVLVGPVLAPRGAGLDDIAAPIPAMLSEELGFVSGAQVVGRRRTLELHAHRHSSPDNVDAARVVARDADADVLVTGSLDPAGKNDYILTLRAENVADRHVLTEARAKGSNPGELVKLAMRDLVPADQPVGGNDRAWQLYEDGLRSLANGEPKIASALLAESFTLDSSHALAAFHLSSALEAAASAPSPDMLRKAVRLANNSSPVDRLRIRVRWAEFNNDPLLKELSDSLVALAPDDPQALFTAASARIQSAEFLAAVPLLRRVVELDSTSRHSKSSECLACRALSLMSSAYAYADSAEVAAKINRELVEWEPDNPDAWETLSIGLAQLGHPSEARLARQRELELRPKDSAIVEIVDAITAVNLEDYSAADQLLSNVRSKSGSTQDDKETADWWLAISLRQQGRFHDALAALARLRSGPSAAQNGAAMLQVGQTYSELGDWQHAYIMFDSAAHLPGQGSDLASAYGRQRTWTLTHVSRARAARGDTVGLMELADTLRNLGELSTYGRDWRLHHFVRAQVLELRGDTAAAIDEYRKSIYSPSLGFTLANYRMARLLIAKRKPREAIAILRSALHGGRDASNMYITAPELHELMANAFEVIAARDSAAFHYSAVAKAWANAEPRWRAHAVTASQRARQLGGEQ